MPQLARNLLAGCSSAQKQLASAMEGERALKALPPDASHVENYSTLACDEDDGRTILGVGFTTSEAASATRARVYEAAREDGWTPARPDQVWKPPEPRECLVKQFGDDLVFLSPVNDTGGDYFIEIIHSPENLACG